MTGAPIDGSLRRVILADPDRGTVVPDSRNKLADDPVLVMEPGNERYVLKFADGLGLTDSYGNVYEGYAGGTSSSVVWVNNPANSVEVGGVDVDGTEDPDPVSGNTIIYDEATESYRSVPNLECTTFIIEKPTNRTYPLALDLPYEIEVIDFQFSFETGPGSASFPLDVYAVGDTPLMTVSLTTGASAFLKAQVTYKKNLIPE